MDILLQKSKMVTYWLFSRSVIFMGHGYIFSVRIDSCLSTLFCFFRLNCNNIEYYKTIPRFFLFLRVDSILHELGPRILFNVGGDIP
jgi:phosphoglycerol transferase MdoB-like AlkP superfamily enzyme